MKSSSASENIFDKKDFTKHYLAKGEYEKCKFTGCNFYNSDLSEIIFIDCEFTGCDLSMANLRNTTLNGIAFNNCKMLGLRFESCNDFGFLPSFESCLLNHSSFFRKKLRRAIFSNSILEEVDFTESDLSGSAFMKCDLTRSLFKNTNLEKADLRSSYNFVIDPEINKIKRAKFSMSSLPGLLDKYDIIID